MSKNGFLFANGKAEKVLNSCLAQNLDVLGDSAVETVVHLRKLTLRVAPAKLQERGGANKLEKSVAAFVKLKGNKPFYGFVKQIGTKSVILDVTSGKAVVLDNEMIASSTNPKKRFEINGVLYTKEETVNGFERFCAVKSR